MPSEIETMPAGPVLDSEVVRNVFGWRCGDDIHAARDHVWDEGEWIPKPRFSTDPRAMMLVLEWLSEQGVRVELDNWYHEPKFKTLGCEILASNGELIAQGEGDTLPLAVARAALAYARSRKLPPPGAVTPQAAPGPL
jgi:hypothetical protein